MQVVATAGHVDHGKSTLVRALTGMEPDRWDEERRRGMTIDLGFAWTTLPTGDVVAFVDVPGHQRFMPNMLAGIGPVAAVMFVVAADEGWCRQSAEHLAALHALGVCHGVLAVTRADLGDADLAIAEARDYLAGTTLAGIEAVAVSPVTGAGIDRLRSALGRLAAAMPAACPGPARLWVDRAFTVRGAGTVATGTLGMGSIAVGDELLLAPPGRPVRVRALQCLKETVPRAGAVSRLAVNLRGISRDEVHRGQALVAPRGWGLAGVLDVRLIRPVDPLPGQLMLHVGSAAVPVRLRRFGADTARLRLARPVPVHVGDRALLQLPGGQRVGAGVVVLDTMPPALRRRGAAAHRATQLAEMSDRPDPAAELRRRGSVRHDQLVAAGVLGPDQDLPPGAVAVEGWLVEPEVWAGWAAALRSAATGWAEANPMAPGMPREAASRAAGLPDPRLLDALIDGVPELVCDAGGVHHRDAAVSFPPEIARSLSKVRDRLSTEPFAAPEAAELAALGLRDRHLAAAVRAGMLLRVGDGVFVLPDAPAEAARRIAALEQPFTLSEGRQALGTTRRVAVPLLELLDARGVTRRVDGNRRVLRCPAGGRA